MDQIDIAQRPSRSVSRRTIVKGAAWSVPAIALAAAAPAFAASQCLPAVIDWNAFADGTTPGTISVPGTTPALTATISVAYSSGSSPSATSGKVVDGPQGGVTGRYYRVEFAPARQNNAATVTITFNRPVRDLRFTILDIDATTGYRDQVVVTTPGFSYQRAAKVIGSGTTADPFRMSAPLANIAPTSSDGNVQLAWAGPLSTISFTYSQPNEAASSQNMVVGIGNVSVDPC